jgi:nucleoid-associated protein YgaU
MEISSLPLSDIARRYREAVNVVASVGKEERHPVPSNPSRPVTVRARAYPASSDATPHLSVAPTSPAPAAISKPAMGSPAFGRPETTDTAKPVRKETAESSRVQVRRGDTLWNLAKKYVGRGEDWPLLAANNPQVTEPEHLLVGTWLRVPEKAANTSATSPAVQMSSRQVRVERGDSLWKLTEAQFGDGRAWGCVAQANPQLQNASLIFPGEILTIPENCAAGAVLQGRYAANSSESLSTRSAELLQQVR